jgi:gas vesicle protein
MSQQNGFSNGFVLGSLVGGVVGGILGTVLATRKEKQIGKTDYHQLETNQEMPFSTQESIELARHGLEDKIAQLNSAIDDVRQQLGTVKASSEQD